MKLLRYLKGRMRAIRNTLLGIPREVLEMRVSDLPITIPPYYAGQRKMTPEVVVARITTTLEMSGIETVGQLIEQTEWNLLKIPNTGRFATNRIKEALALFGLRLKHGPAIPVPPIPARR